ncbi:hypothetical protein AGMMS50276_20740 [Synergistales bacterium]|nr:hypothetical protein AGMMS50276_20740 [Synergistales bacterium]
MSDKIEFERWKDVPEITKLSEEMYKLGLKYQQYVSSGKKDDKPLARKTWQQLSDKYWDLLYEVVDAQTESFPASLTFDKQERLFIDFGFLSDTLTPRNKKFDVEKALNSKAAPGVFQYESFSDFIAECWVAITNQPLTPPVIGVSIPDRINGMTAQLKALQETRNAAFRTIVSRDKNIAGPELDSLCESLCENLVTATKVILRTKEFREAKEEYKQELSQARFRYTEAERVLDIQISIAQKDEMDPLGLPEVEEFEALHNSTRVLARKIVYTLQEEEKLLRRNKRIATECSQFSQKMMRTELRNMITKKKEYMAVPAKVARCEQSLLCPMDSEPMLYETASKLMERYGSLDMDMFTVARIRMYGLPRVIFIPGQGWGTYDWGDHTILLPMFPNTSMEKSLAYGAGTFRWDSDEDRILKNTYENIKDNKGKSILEMAKSFYKDYFMWITKEREGYRILPRETHKAFIQMFAPRKTEE